MTDEKNVLEAVNSEVETKGKITDRWTKKLVEDGWTPISDFFLENYSTMDPPITTSEAMLIVHLMKYKWGSDHPFPRFQKLADSMGMSPTAVRNHARKLRNNQYLECTSRAGRSVWFNLNPLFQKLEVRKDKINTSMKSRRRKTQRAS